MPRTSIYRFSIPLLVVAASAAAAQAPTTLPPLLATCGRDSAGLGRVTTPSVTFHLRPENRVNECAAVPECAALLVPPPPALVVGFSDTERVREAMYRMAIAMTRRPSSTWRNAPPMLYCLGDENYNTSVGPAMVEAVKARIPGARGLSGCASVQTGRNSQVTAMGSTDRAYRIVVNEIVITGDRATASANGSDGGGVAWACVLERTTAGWRPTSCKTTGMS